VKPWRSSSSAEPRHRKKKTLRPRELSRSLSMFAARTPTLPPATHTNSYALGARDVLLVEPATPFKGEQRAWIDWARGLASQGRRALAIVATHHHADHVGGIDELARELGLGSLAGNLRRMLENGINSPVTSSAGRLFDAAGALIGLGGLNRFEGQTPLAVEAAAAGSAARIDFPAAVRDVAPGSGASVELDWQPILEGIVQGRSRGSEPGDLAAGFHRSLAGGIAAVAARAGAGTVALTGGCFQNAMLLDLTCAALRTAGFDVIIHRELPPNDGNIAAGQALAALWNITSVRLP